MLAKINTRRLFNFLINYGYFVMLLAYFVVGFLTGLVVVGFAVSSADVCLDYLGAIAYSIKQPPIVNFR